jgi:hypothetical protein
MITKPSTNSTLSTTGSRKASDNFTSGFALQTRENSGQRDKQSSLAEMFSSHID